MLWAGLPVSTAGSQMQFPTILWHINELTGQPIAPGGVILALILMGPAIQETDTGLSGGISLKAVGEGRRFSRGQPIVFSSVVLDLFATFVSSATARLPIFTKGILHVGPVGYGWLASAQKVGAVGMGILLTFVRQIRRQGRLLLIAGAAFGPATAVFGLSRCFPLTFAALAAAGASDAVSTIIRNTMRQLQTPDRLRARMTRVNQIFFTGGPQLGELEAGLVAQWLGAPFSVVSGGVGCLVTVVWVASSWPALRRYRGTSPPWLGHYPRQQPKLPPRLRQHVHYAPPPGCGCPDRPARSAANRCLVQAPRRPTARPASWSTGTAIIPRARLNSGQLNALGRERPMASLPAPSSRSASAMKTRRASATPPTLATHAGRLGQNGRLSRSHWLTSVPPITMSSAISMGASTGPHQGSGTKKRTSQSCRDPGQPVMTLRKR